MLYIICTLLIFLMSTRQIFNPPSATATHRKPNSMTNRDITLNCHSLSLLVRLGLERIQAQCTLVDLVDLVDIRELVDLAYFVDLVASKPWHNNWNTFWAHLLNIIEVDYVNTFNVEEQI